MRGKIEGFSTLGVGQVSPPVVETCSLEIITFTVHVFKSPRRTLEILNYCDSGTKPMASISNAQSIGVRPVPAAMIAALAPE